LVDSAGQHKPMWEPTSQLARELGTLAPLLLSVERAPAVRVLQGAVRVGSFRKSAGGAAVLVVASTDLQNPTTATLASPPGAGPWRDALSGELFVDRSNGALDVPLNPGSGCVLIGRENAAKSDWLALE
jgi:hypothetical protein